MNRGFSNSGRLPRGGVSPTMVGLSVLMLACFALAGVYFYIVTQPTDKGPAPVAQSQFDLVEVLVPLEKIESGTPLEPTMFRKETKPALSVAPTSVKDYDQLRGAYAASFIAAGQPLLSEYVTLRKPVNQIQSTIPDGYRAVTMSVDETTSVEGWARPGAKVDVVLITSVNTKSTATVVVQNAKVLSAGRGQQNQNGQPAGPSTITLMVTVEESAKIQLASSSGVLSLALRGDEDTVESALNTSINIDGVLGGESAPKPAEIPSEGRVKIDGREFLIVKGKLVPQQGK